MCACSINVKVIRVHESLPLKQMKQPAALKDVNICYKKHAGFCDKLEWPV